jgi:predicted PurR-regulated permease PerM
MSDTTGEQSMSTRTRVDVTFATFLRAALVAALVWMWWVLWRWVLVFVLAALVAVALDPVVQWLERRGVRRTYGAMLTALGLVLLLAGFAWATGAAIADQSRMISARLIEVRDTVWPRIPPQVQQAATAVVPPGETLTRAARAVTGGLAGIGVALVLTLYLLMDGRRTCEWLVAFVPRAHRGRMQETVTAAHRVAAAYVKGNVITSVLCAACTWIVLALLGVPAALVLGLLAGICDFLPVIGFILSAVPAVLLGATVSPIVAAAVAAFFVLYNVVENYYIQPRVYGRELQMSDLAVIAAFLVGAELGGVLGGLVALPLAAMYPAIEQIWSTSPDLEDTTEAHQRIAAEEQH